MRMRPVVALLGVASFVVAAIMFSAFSNGGSVAVAADTAASVTTHDSKLAPAHAKKAVSLEQWAEKFALMVASGKMTAEEAEAKLAAIAAKGSASIEGWAEKKASKLDGQDKDPLSVEQWAAKKKAKVATSLEQWAEKFALMVAYGKMTAEEADAKLAMIAAKSASKG